MTSARTARPHDKPPRASARKGAALARHGLAFLHFVFQVFEGCVLVLFLVAFYLAVVGVPKSLVDKAVARLGSEGVFVRVDRIRLDFVSGLVADQFRFFDGPDRAVPMVEVRKLSLNFNPLDWFHHRYGPSSLGIRDGLLRVNAGGNLQSRHSPQNLAVYRVNARLSFGQDRTEVHRLSAVFLGIRVKGRGAILAEPRRQKMTASDFSRQLSDLLGRMPAWLPPLAEQLNSLDFVEPPEVSVDFSVVTTNLAAATVRLSAEGTRTRFRGAEFDGWNAEAEMRDGKLTVSSLSVIDEGTSCDASGWLVFSNRMSEFDVRSTLPPSSWLCLLPCAVSNSIRKTETRFEGLSAFELHGGPAPLSNVAGRVKGVVALKDAMLRGVWLERAYVTFRRDDRDVIMNSISAVVGRGRQRGSLKANASLRLDTLDFEGHAKTDFDPNAVITILSSNQAREVRIMDFKEHPPETDVQVAGRIGDMRRFTVKGHVQGSRFAYNGADVLFCDSPITISNGVMTLDPLLVVREEGRAEGRVVVDFDREMVDMDATSTADPYAVGLIIGPNIGKFVRNFRFEGPVRIHAKGCVDYGTYRKTDLRAEVEGEKMGMLWALADWCSFKAHAVGPTVRFTDVQASIYGGSATGTAHFTCLDQPSNTHYSIQARVDNAGLDQLVNAIWPNSGGANRGMISATVDVSGVVGEGKGRTVKGAGTVEVREGRLFQIRLFGGLSQMLSRLYPGLGFASQTDFRASYVIRDGKVHTEDAFLEGTVLSVSGQGDYAFTGKLDVNVQVMLLRSGLVANVLRIVTFPVTKLLEFNLGGTLADPKWRPVNLPKELFLITD